MQGQLSQDRADAFARILAGDRKRGLLNPKNLNRDGKARRADRGGMGAETAGRRTEKRST